MEKNKQIVLDAKLVIVQYQTEINKLMEENILLKVQLNQLKKELNK